MHMNMNPSDTLPHQTLTESFLPKIDEMRQRQKNAMESDHVEQNQYRLYRKCCECVERHNTGTGSPLWYYIGRMYQYLYSNRFTPPTRCAHAQRSNPLVKRHAASIPFLGYCQRKQPRLWNFNIWKRSWGLNRPYFCFESSTAARFHETPSEMNPTFQMMVSFFQIGGRNLSQSASWSYAWFHSRFVYWCERD